MRTKILTFSLVLFFLSCKKEKPTLTFPVQEQEVMEQEWFLDEQHILGTLSPFPFFNDPGFVNISESNHIPDDEVAYIWYDNNEVYIFPGRSLFVEVVNGEINNKNLAITYCPLTRSGICWDRGYGERNLKLTASGYLYHDNLMPLDTLSGSIFSQMLGVGVLGKHSSSVVKTYPMLELYWKDAIETWPQAKVYNPFKSTSIKERMKHVHIDSERTFGIPDGMNCRLVRFSKLDNHWKLKEEIFSGNEGVLIGNKHYGTMVAFYTDYEMTAVQSQFPIIMMDETNTYWNIFGEAIKGPRQGERLKQELVYSANRFAWESIFETFSDINY